MSDNSYQGAPAGTESTYEAPASAPDSETTAVSDVADNQEPAGEEQPEEQPKTFTQEEVDRIAQKEREQAYRKAKRDLEAQQQNANRPANQPPPTREQFNSDADYVEALSDHKADQKLMQREQQTQQVNVATVYEERADVARDKYEDFDTVVTRHPSEGGPGITPVMAEAIKESEHGPEIAYYLGKNPAESYRIFGMSTLAQIREIGKIEAKLIENPPAKKISSTPDPIKPIAGTRGTTPKVDVTDPRSDKSMSDDEWINQRNKTARS